MSVCVRACVRVRGHQKGLKQPESLIPMFALNNTAVVCELFSDEHTTIEMTGVYS